MLTGTYLRASSSVEGLRGSTERVPRKASVIIERVSLSPTPARFPLSPDHHLPSSRRPWLPRHLVIAPLSPQPRFSLALGPTCRRSPQTTMDPPPLIPPCLICEKPASLKINPAGGAHLQVPRSVAQARFSLPRPPLARTSTHSLRVPLRTRGCRPSLTTL